MEDVYLTIKELANYLKVKQSTVYNWLNTERIPASKVVGQWRFRRSEIEEWIDSNNNNNNNNNNKQINRQEVSDSGRLSFTDVRVSSSALEKRISNRASINVPVQIEVLNPPQNVPASLLATSLNFSETGACVVLENSILPKAVSANLILDLTKLNKTKVQAICRVVWARPFYENGKFKCGLQFIKVESGQRNIIKQIIMAQRKKRRFAFISNLRDALDWPRVLLTSKFIPRGQSFKALKEEPGYVVWSRFNVYGQVEGFFVVILLTGQEMMSLPPKDVREKIMKAAIFAQDELGADIIGLGSYVPSVTNKGLWLAAQQGIKANITHGDSFTVWNAIQGIKRADIDLERTTVAIIGAYGLMGEAISRIIAKKCRNLILMGRSQNKLSRLKELIISENSNHQINLTTTTDMSQIKSSELIISLTSSTSALFEAGYIKEGAVVYDLAQPIDVSPELCEQRPDILRIDGGFVEIPGIDLAIDTGLPANTTWACLAETILQSLENKRENFIGPIQSSWIEQTGKWAKKYGFSHADFTCFSWPLTHRLDNLLPKAKIKEKTYQEQI